MRIAIFTCGAIIGFVASELLRKYSAADLAWLDNYSRRGYGY